MQAPGKKKRSPHIFKNQESKDRFATNSQLLESGKLSCKNHASTPAVALCDYCGYGICKECGVVYGSKMYCKEDAEFLLKRARTGLEGNRRGVPISLAAVISVFNGLWAVSVGFLLMMIGMLGPVVKSSPIIASSVSGFTSYFGELYLFPPEQTLIVGSVSLIAGLIDMVSGYYIWKQSRTWAIIGVAAAIFGPLFTSGYLQLLAIAGVVAIVVLGLGIVKIGLVGLGWKRLR